MNMQQIIIQDSKTITHKAMSMFLALAKQAIDKRGVFSVALSGGSTPESLYRALVDSAVQAQINWQKVHLFWGDERNVPASDPDSNYRMVNEALMKHIAIPAENVHRVPTEMTVTEAAIAYEKDLRLFFPGDWPRFDLVLLGMGEDGHTASLFPHSEGLADEKRWFIANFAPKRDFWRLTLTKNAINAARHVLVLVKGAHKAPMLAQVLRGDFNPIEKPIQSINPVDGQLTWLLDEDVASLLPPELIA
jgi:6-phosphogluconolactonase